MARLRFPCFALSTLVLAAAAVACSPKSKAEEDEPSDAKAGPAQAEASAEAGEGDTTTGDAAVEADTGGAEGETGAPPEPVDLEVKTGVDSCDGYAQWWSTCVHEHAPEDKRGDLERELSEQLAAWKQTVDGGGSAAAVEIGCATALEAAKAMSAEWDCEAPGDAP